MNEIQSASIESHTRSDECRIGTLPFVAMS